MKNTGLKIPEKDRIYVYVGFSYYLRDKIIGKSFSILYFKCKLEPLRGTYRGPVGHGIA